MEAGQLNAQVFALHRQGKFREAILVADASLKIRREALGERHPDTATSLNNLTTLYKSQGKYAEAEPLYKDALKINREALARSTPTLPPA